MTAEEQREVQVRWNEIINAIDAAGIPRDDLSIVAIVAGAQLLQERMAKMTAREARRIGFVPSRKES